MKIAPRSARLLLLPIALVLAGCEGVIEDGSAPDDVIHATVGQPARVYNTGGTGLNMRTGPGSTYAVIKLLPEGTIVSVIGGPTSSYYKITHGGSTGWAHGSYLQTIKGRDNLLPWTANKAFQCTQGHNGGSHTGAGAWAWDFGMPVGTPLRAAHYGTVRRVKNDSTVGGCNSVYANSANFVIVDQGNGYESLYLHLKSVSVRVGQWVNRGDIVGYSGQTGWSCGPHLHFQIQRSPSNGGYGWYNQSIHDYFYDPGYAYDPAPGVWYTSKNGIANIPSLAGETGATDVETPTFHETGSAGSPPPPVLEGMPGGGVDFHGGSGAEWDRAMQAASALGQ